MRRRIATVALLSIAIFMMAGCAAREPWAYTRPTVSPPPRPQPEVQRDPGSPCSDSLYVALKQVPMEEMTEREYQYFIQKDAACDEYQQIDMTSGRSIEETRTTNKAKEDFRMTWLGAAVLSILAYTVIALALL